MNKLPPWSIEQSLSIMDANETEASAFVFTFLESVLN
jgi:hypothetical protein